MSGDRERFFDAAAAYTRVVLADAPPARFLVKTGDETVGRSLFLRGTRSDATMLARTVAVLEALAGPEAIAGRSLIDVGANLGTTTVFALLSHPFACSVACEPEPSNFALLKANVVLNDLDAEVRALPVAVSSSSGTAELAVHPTNSGGHQVVAGDGPTRAGPDAPGEGRVTVEKVTLDALADGGVFDPEDVGLVWVDVQGHEGHVLRGATKLARLGTPTLVEFYPQLLRESGGLELLDAVARKRYTHYVDMREVATSPTLTFNPHPTEKLGRLAERYEARGRPSFTDLLLVRDPGA